MRWIALVALFLGCAEQPQGDPVQGTRTDVMTPPGDHGGYRVVTACMDAWTDVGVIGTGTIAITDVDAIGAAGRELATQLADMESIWGSGGYGLACEPGIGTAINLDNWRDVDEVIERTGAWLRERDYALQIGIAVGSVPVAHAGGH